MLILYTEMRKLVTTAAIVKRLRWLPIKGKLNPNLMTVSDADRSGAHKKLCPRKAIVELKKLYSAKKIGICSKAGIQPPSGFTPASRNNFICSTLICC